MSKIVYKSKIDWWVWLTLVITVCVTMVLALESTLWVTLSLGGAMFVWVLLIFGCWYEIEEDQLVVYQFFRPNIFPIEKIKEVKKTTGYLATAGMSCRRVSIKFSDRSVMKSSMPLEISPKERDRFIVQLKEINPKIIVNGENAGQKSE